MIYKTKILIVDDNPSNILVLASLIAAPDVEILSATSGDEALSLLLEQRVALVLLDTQMPKINGFDIARLMRLSEQSKKVPIIFVTSSPRSRTNVFEGYENGAVDFLFRPIDPHIVLSKVRVFIDLDQRNHTLEKQLAEVKELKNASDAANRAKSAFLANMSHEIRTPLGAIVGFAELLSFASEDLDPELRNYIAAISKNGKHLQDLINDILDLSKIEAERIQVEYSHLSLPKLIRDIFQLHNQQATEKNLRFSFIPLTPLPVTIYSDPLLIRQILNNLIGNAIKFTSSGSVQVEIKLEPHATGSQLIFIVKDTGCGLSLAAQVGLFQPFSQSDSSTKRKFGGTGLGLTISRKLARLLGGDVVLSASNLGKGSTFIASIDPGSLDNCTMVAPNNFMASTQYTDIKNSIAGKLKGAHVLVTDDVPDNRRLIARFLELAGADVTLAANGREALNAVEKTKSQIFDVIIMDLQMPEMDGYEATEKLRQNGFSGPIIALTAHAMKEEIDRCLNVGFDFYLSKPILPHQLVSRVESFLPSRSTLHSTVG